VWDNCNKKKSVGQKKSVPTTNHISYTIHESNHNTSNCIDICKIILLRISMNYFIFLKKYLWIIIIMFLKRSIN